MRDTLKKQIAKIQSIKIFRLIRSENDNTTINKNTVYISIGIVFRHYKINTNIEI